MAPHRRGERRAIHNCSHLLHAEHRQNVRINDIRPRILLRQAVNGRFGEAAAQRRHVLDRHLWADQVDMVALASRMARSAPQSGFEQTIALGGRCSERQVL